MQRKQECQIAMLDRLLLNEERILGICDDVLKLIHLKDPVGENCKRNQTT